jgi:hypothetical protein
MTAAMTAVHTTLSGLTTGIQNLGHKVYMDSFFSTFGLFVDLDMQDINSCGSVRPN